MIDECLKVMNAHTCHTLPASRLEVPFQMQCKNGFSRIFFIQKQSIPRINTTAATPPPTKPPLDRTPPAAYRHSLSSNSLTNRLKKHFVEQKNFISCFGWFLLFFIFFFLREWGGAPVGDYRTCTGLGTLAQMENAQDQFSCVFIKLSSMQRLSINSFLLCCFPYFTSAAVLLR